MCNCGSVVCFILPVKPRQIVTISYRNGWVCFPFPPQYDNWRLITAGVGPWPGSPVSAPPSRTSTITALTARLWWGRRGPASNNNNRLMFVM